ncbi:hypothetical protein CAter282_3064 [Collimonas arenae]|uniref:Uncharacterized protein n=1 Tax=Collimonas arenae TaxID=279058 RepID=A0A127PTC9_9BURK|nr:hypothetical protein [Collimonas arenae]AMP00885.1 hypothetical protein CAter10_3368 [Collimonas arenae]AMP10775.1 hypothetical protein CAter282_3064 [Collimonas arenae]
MDLIEKFDAKDKSGNGYHVEGYESPIEIAAAGGVISSMPGPRTYRLADGRALTQITDGKFVIVQTGDKIYRI